MKQIHKYQLRAGVTAVPISASAKILDVQTQRGVPCLWVLVDLEVEAQFPDVAEAPRRHFTGYATGEELPDNLGEYVGTFQLRDGAYVFHLFEVEGL